MLYCAGCRASHQHHLLGAHTFFFSPSLFNSLLPSFSILLAQPTSCQLTTFLCLFALLLTLTALFLIKLWSPEFSLSPCFLFCTYLSLYHILRQLQGGVFWGVQGFSHKSFVPFLCIVNVRWHLIRLASSVQKINNCVGTFLILYTKLKGTNWGREVDYDSQSVFQLDHPISKLKY